MLPLHNILEKLGCSRNVGWVERSVDDRREASRRVTQQLILLGFVPQPRGSKTAQTTTHPQLSPPTSPPIAG